MAERIKRHKDVATRDTHSRSPWDPRRKGIPYYEAEDGWPVSQDVSGIEVLVSGAAGEIIDVDGVGGELADPQPPLPHASSHEDGGADELEVADLATSESDSTLVLRPDGTGGVAWGEETSSAAGGFVPTLIPSGETFTVPEDYQALFALMIDVQGTLVVDGFLVEVD